jgi:hypothetical protein
MASERNDPPVSKILTDRIRADPELVEQVLNPDRTDDNVRYRDPEFPRESPGGESAPDSLADLKMARRTDAGLRQASGPLGGSAPAALLWIALAVVAVAIIIMLVAT